MQILNDFNTSVRRALEEIDQNYESYEGLVICGTHSPHNVEDMIREIKNARENGLPTLGICFGMQLMAIEYARNVIGIKDATSEEFGEGTLVVKKLPKLRVGMVNLDKLKAVSTASKHKEYIYKTTFGNQSHWHNYYVDADLITKNKTHDKHLNLSCFLEGGIWIPEYLDVLQTGPYEGVQFHPEYQSSKDNPHPLLVKFIELCKK